MGSSAGSAAPGRLPVFPTPLAPPSGWFVVAGCPARGRASRSCHRPPRSPPPRYLSSAGRWSLLPLPPAMPGPSVPVAPRNSAGRPRRSRRAHGRFELGGHPVVQRRRHVSDSAVVPTAGRGKRVCPLALRLARRALVFSPCRARSLASASCSRPAAVALALMPSLDTPRIRLPLALPAGRGCSGPILNTPTPAAPSSTGPGGCPALAGRRCFRARFRGPAKPPTARWCGVLLRSRAGPCPPGGRSSWVARWPRAPGSPRPGLRPGRGFSSGAVGLVPACVVPLRKTAPQWSCKARLVPRARWAPGRRRLSVSHDDKAVALLCLIRQQGPAVMLGWRAGDQRVGVTTPQLSG